MRRFTGAALIVGGIVLMIYGLDGPDPLFSRLSRLFSGWPPDSSVWLVFGGAGAAAGGLFLTSFGRNLRA